MKKNILVALALAVLTLTVSGCGAISSSVDETPVSAGEFEAEILTGGTFSQEDLQKYDITMVNVWGTFCNPCLNEMPELQKIYEALPENANMILICTDWQTEEETALKIIKDLGLTMPNLKDNDQLNSGLLKSVKAIPTTFFLDKDGNQVGKSLVGAPSNKEKIVAYYTEQLNSALETVTK